MTERAAIWLLIFALAGLASSAASSYVHYQLIRQPDFVSFCDVSATVSCTQVYQSPYAMLMGVPVALLGTIFFALIVVLIGAGWRAGPLHENLPGYVFGLSTIGLAVSLYLAYASFVILKAVCLLCVGTYLAVLGLFLVSGAVLSFPMSSLPGRARRDLANLVRRPVALIVALMFFAAAATTVAFFPREDASHTVDSAMQASGASNPVQDQSRFERWAAEPRHTIPIPQGDEKVLVVKFNDYQCPPCRQTYFMYQPIVAKYRRENPSAVRFVTLDFPLDPECNVAAPGGGHFAACEAAVAVRLAKGRLKGLDMEQWLFSNQPSLTPPMVRDAVRKIAGIENWDAVYQPTLAGVRADIDIGRKLSVTSTPTFFINGKRVPGGGLAPEDLDAVIAWELKNAK